MLLVLFTNYSDNCYRNSRTTFQKQYQYTCICWQSIIAQQKVPHTELHTHLYMFRAICKFTQFWNALHQLEIAKLQTDFEMGIQFRNCAAQFRNFGIDGGETVCINDECRRHEHRLSGQHFEAFCCCSPVLVATGNSVWCHYIIVTVFTSKCSS